MFVSISASLFVCDVSTCIVVAIKVVPVSSLQISAVALPLMLLQMVNEVALVEPLNTPVTEGTLCRETADLLAWPTNVGVGGHLLAIVSCSESNLTGDIHGHQKSIGAMMQCDDSWCSVYCDKISIPIMECISCLYILKYLISAKHS